MSVWLISCYTTLRAFSVAALTAVFRAQSISEFRSDKNGREDMIAGGNVGIRPLLLICASFEGPTFDDDYS